MAIPAMPAVFKLQLRGVALGYPGMGLLKLFTAGGFGIIWLIDIIGIATENLQPADGSDYVENIRYNPTHLDSNNITYQEKPKPADGWKCPMCETINYPYVSTCSCGYSRLSPVKTIKESEISQSKPNDSSIESRLKKLESLKMQGIITEEEYQEQRVKIISTI